MVQKVDWIWFDGKLVRWEDAQIHLLTHSFHYGLAAFEGIRCYQQKAGGAAIFRLHEHLQRLYNSAHICLIDVPFTREDLVEACKQVVSKNNLQDGCYLRPLVFMGEGAMGIAAMDNPIHVAVIGWRWGAYLGEEGLKNGIRARISSFRRPRGDALMAKGKITGQYVNSILAKREAIKAGYQESILLDEKGYVCEATGENIFMVERGRVRTPGTKEAILVGVTRDTVLQLCKDEGIPTVEEAFPRDELYCADEVFLTGTAAEITPVREVDDRRIGQGKPGEITKRLQEKFFGVVRGTEPKYKHWLTAV